MYERNRRQVRLPKDGGHNSLANRAATPQILALWALFVTNNSVNFVAQIWHYRKLSGKVWLAYNTRAAASLEGGLSS